MILDTNAVSAVLAGDTEIERVLSGADRHHLPLVVIGEYRFGLIGSRKRKQIERWFNQLIDESVVIALDRETTDHYATIRHELKRKGRPIPENDVWIVALAKQHGLEIVSLDEHFDHVAGIRRVSW